MLKFTSALTKDSWKEIPADVTGVFLPEPFPLVKPAQFICKTADGSVELF